MNEGTKTGIFWGVAVATLGVATLVAWPATREDETGGFIGKPLFEEFKDPLVAASLKIVTYDEVDATLQSFEVRRDPESGQWTIPSRKGPSNKGYPADAVDHMKEAANSLVDLKVLDIQSENPEDHEGLGVAEPKLEALKPGDEGVGRLITLRDDSQKTLASLIIGQRLKDDPTKVYVRKPGQDPVYVVKLDDTPLTTRFQDWIEEDLLKLSSIDIDSMEIKDYSASLGGNGISLQRNYAATVVMDGSQWKLDKLLKYSEKNPLAEPTPIAVKDGEELNATKLNDMKNALDDLKIVDVVRKPAGISENLRADKDLVSDQEALESLARRGFYPLQTSDGGEYEMISANGELTVSLTNGVQYLLRFGNVSGLTDEADQEPSEGDEKPSAGGVNRYLLVTTQVDEAKFPAPKLREIPKTLEELEAMLAKPEADAAAEPPVGEVKSNDAPAAEAEMKPGDAKSESAEESATPAEEPSKTEDAKAADAKPEDAKPEEPAAKEKASEPDAEAADKETADTESETPAESGESELEGSGEASGQGEAEEEVQDDTAAEKDAEAETPAEPKADTEAAMEKPSDAKSGDASGDASDAKPAADAKDSPKQEELSEEEKLERLASEQEKITKENQRMLDERKDKLEVARRRVRDLNARFADWYYVIPEETYRKLRLSREELFASEEAPANPNAGFPGGPGAMPQFNFGPPGQ
ncbi:hypothetical protein Pla52o_00150 [Novipirellula galeiformis]|uniref:DUF4340 domain-containing protein n=1 Tax=Novipirellula galeiformis TaxID=2528004 RepID=A0A5C6CMK1_9BACT|nr:DUF4340 domain-containing protein [Novipirellula galeiformis]TWU26163.1 hypothetical protein Pla52o_00150 [Novipirellula galeiformis]